MCRRERWVAAARLRYGPKHRPASQNHPSVPAEQCFRRNGASRTSMVGALESTSCMPTAILGLASAGAEARLKSIANRSSAVCRAYVTELAPSAYSAGNPLDSFAPPCRRKEAERQSRLALPEPAFPERSWAPQCKGESACSNTRTSSGRSEVTVAQIVSVSQSKYPCVSRFRIAVTCGH
jgi:hypothetical protein